MIANLRATLAVASALTVFGAAESASNVAFAGDITRTPASLYSPMPLAEQPITLQTFAAAPADYFATPTYGPPGPVSHFEPSQPPSAQSAAPAGPPTAWLALRG